ncbi:hypothetical protein FHG87_001605 [Trinorchestia longiramus]|nr:hypothetical protein FHG87_001605 [Trinorchestia longiramus]
MAKSLRSKKERTKRRTKRYKDRLPREKARLQKLAEAALARETQEAIEEEDAGLPGPLRRRRQLVRYNHVRSLRSRPVAYQTQELVSKEYVSEKRDYMRFLDHTEGDSDDNDILSDSDTDFQEEFFKGRTFLSKWTFRRHYKLNEVFLENFPYEEPMCEEQRAKSFTSTCITEPAVPVPT